MRKRRTPKNEGFLTVREVADLYDKSPRTIYGWLAGGCLEFARDKATSHIIISWRALDRFARQWLDDEGGGE